MGKAPTRSAKKRAADALPTEAALHQAVRSPKRAESSRRLVRPDDPFFESLGCLSQGVEDAKLPVGG
jgi:hypothetical protein